MRTRVGTAVNGSMAAVVGASISMWGSSIVWKPRMDEPSKPIPSSKSSSLSSPTGIEKCCQRPGASMKRRATILAPFSLASLMTSFGVMRRLLARDPRRRRGPNEMVGTPRTYWDARAKSSGYSRFGLSLHGLRKRPAARDPVARALQRIGVLRVLGEIEPRDLVLVGDAKAHGRVEDLQNDHGPEERQHPRSQDGDDLSSHFAGLAGEESVFAVGVDRRGREEAGGQRPPGPPHAVNADHVQRVVVAHLRLEVAGVVAEEPRDGADDDGGQWGHVA